MKITFSAVLVLASGCGASSVDAADVCGPTAVHISTDRAGVETSLILDGAALARTPDWKPGAGDPPLSVGKATAIAMAWGNVRFKRKGGVLIRRIVLDPYTCWDVRRWYYRFEFTNKDGRELSGGADFAAVLMDGKLVGAIRSK